MKRGLWIFAGVSAALLLCSSLFAPLLRDDLQGLAHGFVERNDGTDLADKLTTPDTLLDYAVSHPEQVALASWQVGREGEGISFNADRAQPVAAASQLLLLAAHAGQVAAGAQPVAARVPLAEWQRYAFPDQDGDAHRAALLEARALGALPAEALRDAGEVPDGLSVPASALLRALVRYGDPAASDYLLAHLGRERLLSAVRSFGLPADAAPLPQAGLPLSWLARPPLERAEPSGAALASTAWLRAEPAAELLARYDALGPLRYADAAWQQLEQLRDDSAQRARSAAVSPALTLRERAQLAAALPPRGTARDYASLISRLANGQLPGGDQVCAELEAGPRANGSAPGEQLGRIAGSQPGMLASVAYAREPGRPDGARVVALFFHDLPLAVWLKLSAGFLVQRFERELLAGEAFFEQARQRTSSHVAREPSAEPEFHTSAAPR